MIVTLVSDVLGEENNGTTIAAMNLVRSLRAKGHTVRIVCADQSRNGQKDFYIVPKLNLGPINGYVAKNGVTLSKPDDRVLTEAIKDADVVHIMMPLALGNRAAKIARKLGKPITAGFHAQAENITAHVFSMHSALINRIVYKVFYRKLYRYCTAIHYPSQFIKNVFEDIVGPTNGYVISNGVNRRFVRKPSIKPEELSGKYVILFTGRYSKEKSHRVLIDGAAYSKYADRIQLVFAGSGPLKNELEAYAAKRLPVAPIFRFFSRDELVDIINYADLYVHPSEAEIEAIACLEAIACGLVPVIADSPKCATKAFAIGENNLFKCNDPVDLSRKIDYWIEHPEEKRECSQKYLDYARNFDQDRCMDRMERMLLTAAGLSASAQEPAYAQEQQPVSALDGDDGCGMADDAAVRTHA